MEFAAKGFIEVIAPISPRLYSCIGRNCQGQRVCLIKNVFVRGIYFQEARAQVIISTGIKVSISFFKRLVRVFLYPLRCYPSKNGQLR